jgi:hypothetical protein
MSGLQGEKPGNLARPVQSTVNAPRKLKEVYLGEEDRYEMT